MLSCGMLLILTAGAHAAPAAPPQLDWLAGHWCGTGQPRVEEFWLPPAGGELLGLNRTIQQDRVVAFEFLRIAEHDGALSYLAQPGGRPLTAFRWTAGGKDWVRFENPRHDFPTLIEYRRKGATLEAEIAGPDGAGGEQRISFSFEICSDATGAPAARPRTDSAETSSW